MFAYNNTKLNDQGLIPDVFLISNSINTNRSQCIPSYAKNILENSFMIATCITIGDFANTINCHY